MKCNECKEKPIAFFKKMGRHSIRMYGISILAIYRSIYFESCLKVLFIHSCLFCHCRIELKILIFTIEHFIAAKHSKYDDRGDDISEKSTAQCADLYVAGLPWNTTEKMFRKYFEKFGKVKIAKIMKNIETGTSRGFGFIRFDLYECEMKALSSSHIIDGRRCSVTYARMLAGSVAKFNQFPRDIKNHTGKGNSVFVSNAMRKSIKNKCNNGDGENTQQICVYGGCDIGENDKIQSALPDDDNMSNYDYPPMPYNNDNSDLPTLQSIEINEKNPFL